MPIPAELLAHGVVHNLERLEFFASRRQISMRVSGATGAGDLTALWETQNPALIVSAGTAAISLPGPDSTAAGSRDPSEPYTWTLPDGDDSIQTFITAYRALSASARSSTQLTLTDGAFPDIEGAQFRAGSPYMEAGLAERVDIPVEFRAGTPRLDAIVDWPIAAEFRAGKPRIDAQPSGGIVAVFRAGNPRFEVIPASDIVADFRAGTPRVTAIPGGDIVAAFRAGLPSFEVIPGGDIVAAFRAGVPSIDAQVITGIVAVFRAGNPRFEVIPGGDIVASFRAGTPRVRAIPFSEIRAEFYAGVPKIEALVVGDLFVTFRAGVPRFEPVVSFLPQRPVGTRTELHDGYVLVEVEDIDQLGDVGGFFEYQIGDGNWRRLG